MSKEKCVICGVETPYDFETHIDLREFYIEGAGQLCRKCYNNPTVVSSENKMVFEIPFSTVLDNPNDSDLGRIVRQLYYKQK